MTRDLLPHQRSVWQWLQAERPNNRLAIQAPPGMGLAAPIARHIGAQVTGGATVLVVTDARALAMQWANRLSSEIDESWVTVLWSSADVLLMLESQVPERQFGHQVVVATVQLLERGVGRRLAATLSPTLLVLDHVSGIDGRGPRAAVLDGLISRARRTLILFDPTSVFPLSGPTDLFVIGLPEALRSRGSLTLSVSACHLDGNELSVLNEVDGLLQDVNSHARSPVTRPAVHGALTRLIARLSDDEVPPPELKDRRSTRAAQVEWAWDLIDRLEGLGEDPRLLVLEEAIAEAKSAGDPILVLCDGPEEVAYVAGYLKDRDLPADELSTTTDQIRRAYLLSGFDDERILVASIAALRGVELPSGTKQIWWSPPRSMEEAILRLLRTRDAAKAVAILADPPIESEDALRSIVQEIIGLI